jgi:hypothetical protein
VGGDERQHRHRQAENGGLGNAAPNTVMTTLLATSYVLMDVLLR